MKAHIGVDDDSGLVHSVIGTVASVADVTLVDKLLHGEELHACARATPVSKSVPITQAARLSGRFPACRSTYKSLGKRSLLGRVSSQIEKAKAQTRAKVERPFQVIKCQFSRTIID